MHGKISQRHHPPSPVRFRTHKQQDCLNSRDSLGTVLSESVESCDLHLFPINNPSLDTDNILAVACQNTPPPELQIPAIVVFLPHTANTILVTPAQITILEKIVLL